MDRGIGARRTVLAVAVLACAGSPLHGHPHNDVDQQVLLSISPARLDITVRIVPSPQEAAAILATIDGNGDGAVSSAEAAAWGKAVFDTVSIRLGGVAVRPDSIAVRVPETALVLAGTGMIEIGATAPLAAGGGLALETGAGTGSGMDARLDFAIGYEEFAHDWFVQPFLSQDLAGAAPAQPVERLAGQSGIAVNLRLPAP
jgi:hypothetical protein